MWAWPLVVDSADSVVPTVNEDVDGDVVGAVVVANVELLGSNLRLPCRLRWDLRLPLHRPLSWALVVIAPGARLGGMLVLVVVVVVVLVVVVVVVVVDVVVVVVIMVTGPGATTAPAISVVVLPLCALRSSRPTSDMISLSR